MLCKNYSWFIVASSTWLLPVGRCLWPPLKTCPSTPRGPRALAGPPLPFWRAPCACGRATGPVSSRRSGSPSPTSPGWRCSSRSGSPQELRGGDQWSREWGPKEHIRLCWCQSDPGVVTHVSNGAHSPSYRLAFRDLNSKTQVWNSNVSYTRIKKKDTKFSTVHTWKCTD